MMEPPNLRLANRAYLENVAKAAHKLFKRREDPLVLIDRKDCILIHEQDAMDLHRRLCELTANCKERSNVKTK